MSTDKSGFTEYMVHMRMENGCWQPPALLPRRQVFRCPQNSGAFFGLTATETVRVSLDGDSVAGLFCPQNAIARLNVAAGELLLPPADEELVMNSLCMLVDNERHLLYDGGSFFARIMLSCDDGALYPYPVNRAFLTITLWCEKSTRELLDVSAFADKQSEPCYAPGNTAAYLGAMCQKREKARQLGYDRMLLLDNVYKKYILSLSGSNVFFRIGDQVVTPAGDGVFPGITKKCAMELMQSWDIDVKERKLSRDELTQAYSDGILHEAFATDTYCIVSAVTKIDGLDTAIELTRGKLTKKLFDAILNIEKGTYPAFSEWIKKI